MFTETLFVKLKTVTQMSIIRMLSFYTMVYPYNGIILSDKKE